MSPAWSRVSVPVRASSGTTGCPEFTAHWHVARACWVIRRHGQPYLDIPQEYGVTITHVAHIVVGKRWKHVA